MSVDEFLFIPENRVQSLSPLYFPPFELTLSLTHPDLLFMKGKWSVSMAVDYDLPEERVCSWHFEMDLQPLCGQSQAAAVLCGFTGSKSCLPCKPPCLACFGIPEHAAVPPSSTSHSAPWARSSLKLQQTFILELRNSDLCLSGCFDRERTWGLRRDRGEQGGRRRRVYLRPAKINVTKFLVSLCWSFLTELVQWGMQCIPVPTLSSLEEGQ